MKQVGLIRRDHAGMAQHRSVTVGRGTQPDTTQLRLERGRVTQSTIVYHSSHVIANEISQDG